MSKRYILRVNGEQREAEAEPHHSLLDVLREEMRLTGSKIGCNEAECGSCTLMLSGVPVLSCLTLMGDVRDREVLTIEGIARNGKPHPIQTRMTDLGGIQCGYCTPGIIMSAYALLQENSDPTSEEVRQAISGNICRCTGYSKIVEAVQAAAADMREKPW